MEAILAGLAIIVIALLIGKILNQRDEINVLHEDVADLIKDVFELCQELDALEVATGTEITKATVVGPEGEPVSSPRTSPNFGVLPS
jgi:hypothetical protein